MFDHYRSYPSLAMDEIMNVFDSTDHRRLEPVNFGKGVSSFNPFEHVDIHLDRKMLGRHVSYGDINGMASLRHAVCRHYREQFGYDLSPERVCITDGASGALTIALAMLLETGGEIILPESHYPAYRVMAKIFSARCRFVPVRDDYCIDVEQLPRFISSKTQAILINSPSNPHGAVLSAAELEGIASLGVPVIFDEVYQDLPLGDTPIPSAIHVADQHMIINSLSKSLAIAGFRIGYLIVPEAQVALMTNVKAVLNMCTSLPSQLLALELLQHRDELVGKHRALLRHNWAMFKQTASHLGLNLRSQPQAGFFALVDVADGGRDAMQMALELAQYHAIGSVPGIDFQQRDNAFLRLNFACPTPQIEAGLKRLANYLEQTECLSRSKLVSLNRRRDTVKPFSKASRPMKHFLGAVT